MQRTISGARILALIVGVFAALPLAYLVVRAAQLGPDTLWSTVVSGRTLGLLWRTVILAVAVTVSSILIAVPVAWLTTRTDVPGRRTFTVLTVLPLTIPTYVGAWALIGAFGPKGIAQDLLEPLGVDRLPPIYGFAGAWVALTLFSFPYVLLPVRAAFSRLDPSLEEASRILGHTPAATFRRIVLPQLRPAIAAGGLLVALYVLSDFGAVSMLRYKTFTQDIYVQYRGGLNREAAAALGLVLVVLTTTVVAIEQRTRRRAELYRLHGGTARQAPTVALGRWRWPSVAALATLSGIALIGPLAVIGFWLWRGIRAAEPVMPGWDLVGASITGSFLGALVTVLAAIPVAWVAVRQPGPFARVVETMSWAGFALPGIVVALSLVFFGARNAPWLYQSLGLLVFAYAVLFLPQALAAIRTPMLQVPPQLEEASRMLGQGPSTTTRRIVVPLIQPGVLAGFNLVILSCMKELPATLLLAPTGFDTLATRMWGATSEGFLGRSAGAALGLVLLASLPSALLLGRGVSIGNRPVSARRDTPVG